MSTFLYNLFIFPIIQIIELCFVFVYRIFHNYGVALFGVSIAVSVFTLPFYYAAEKYQQKERDLQNRMKPKLNKIRAVLKGDEQYMIISTYYRQNHYHPVFAMRTTFGLLIQIPFFIAAYLYLSHLKILQGASFFFIKDLSAPDGIISFYNNRFNILPVLMTFINIVSSFIYTKAFELKDKIQLYGISIIFLVLLYNSPSGLVIYWTMINIFSLGKNILQKTKYSRKIVFCLLFPAIFAIDIFLLFFHRGDLPKRLLAAILLSSFLLLPLISKTFNSLKIFKSFINDESSRNKFPVYLYILSCITLFLLHGGIVPFSLIASSVQDFSFIDSRTTPLPFIFNTLAQSVGIFIFWPLVIYFLFSAKIRRILSFFMVIVSAVAMINVFFIRENFGFLTLTMTFSEPKPFYLIPDLYIINAVIICFAAAILFFFFVSNKMIFIASAQVIIIIALLGLGVINMKKIHDDFALVQKQYEGQHEIVKNIISEYTFSKTGKNVLLIMLDAAVGGYIPYIFDEKPELNTMMQGFHFYPNSISFANHTLIGALPVYGGYEYTPKAVNNRSNVPLLEKQREAYLLLPRLFSNAGYSVTITDPPFDNFMTSNLAVFSEYPEYDAKNLIGKYTLQWLQEHPDIDTVNISELLDKNLIRFSFFKSAPLFLRLIIYDKGNWLTLIDDSRNQLTNTVIDDYAFLDTLDKITAFTDNGDIYTAVYAHLPHSAAFLQAPDYIPVKQVTYRGSSSLANDAHFHLATASFLLLGKWFDYLKANDVYDNTRIIIVSDHGRGSTDLPGNIILPNGSSFRAYNVLLMIKDFDSKDTLSISDKFMTNGDVPLLALEGLIDHPVNPFTGIPLKANKDNGITITTIGAVSTYRHNKFGYNIGRNQWLFVKDNIFDPANWRVVSQ